MSRFVFIQTYGCQMNVHDTEKMYGVLRMKGYHRARSADYADLIILNTCSIRQKAEQKFYSELGRLKSHKRKKPALIIAVAGCIAQQEGNNLFRRAPHVDFVFGPQNIHVLQHFGEQRTPFAALDENHSIALHDLPAERTNEARAWVNIMYGCNNYCSYCIVPYTRGRERSRPSENIVREITELAERGCKEVTLLGQNVNSYRSDVDFAGLLRKLHAIAGLRRIRFVTSHPKDLSLKLIRAISDLPKVCEHIHLPLQSGSDTMLRRMNRGYSYESYLQQIETLRRCVPGISITTDIICGFPGESDQDHMRTIEALTEIRFDGIFAFAYSPRPFTAAATFQPQIPEGVKMQRLHEILMLQDAITLEKNRVLDGSVQEIMIEGSSETDRCKAMGRTRTNKIVTVGNINALEGNFMQVRIIKVRKHSLEGAPLL